MQGLLGEPEPSGSPSPERPNSEALQGSLSLYVFPQHIVYSFGSLADCIWLVLFPYFKNIFKNCYSFCVYGCFAFMYVCTTCVSVGVTNGCTLP